MKVYALTELLNDGLATYTSLIGVYYSPIGAKQNKLVKDAKWNKNNEQKEHREYTDKMYTSDGDAVTYYIDECEVQ